MTNTILDRWGITASELTQIIDGNPSLRGFLLGYVGEFQLRKIWFSDARITNIRKYDDHARDVGKKNDLVVCYKGFDFTIEVKSLQTLSIKEKDGIYTARVQVDASDSRDVTLPNGERVKTTCLVVGEFDVLAVNLFSFREKWDYIFALNRDLPRSAFGKYTSEQQQYLLATAVNVSWPPQSLLSLIPLSFSISWSQKKIFNPPLRKPGSTSDSYERGPAFLTGSHSAYCF